MKSNYKQTFDAVRMSPDRQERIRSELSARFSEKQKEDNIVSIKSRSTKKLLVAAVVAIVILSSLTIVTLAYGSQIIQMLGGGQIVMETTGRSSSVSMTVYEESNPVEVRDGQVYFILDGSNTDITSYCTETTYYQYEKIADNGYRHVFIVGGAPDNLGWAEYIWDETGHMFASSQVIPGTFDTGESPIWLENANKQFWDW